MICKCSVVQETFLLPLQKRQRIRYYWTHRLPSIVLLLASQEVLVDLNVFTRQPRTPNFCKQLKLSLVAMRFAFSSM
jgi:hypothetical protein